MNRATGLSHGCLALAGGAQRWGGRATDRSGAARPGKAPSISYMEGALFDWRGPCLQGGAVFTRYQGLT